MNIDGDPYARMTENLINRHPLCVDNPVRKVKGYQFDGTVVSVFFNKAGETRYVVEHDTCVGMLHIFNRDQLELRGRPLYPPIRQPLEKADL